MKINDILLCKVFSKRYSTLTVRICKYDRVPHREEFFVPNGEEVEWGGGYQELGQFNDAAFEYAREIYYRQGYNYTLKLTRDQVARFKAGDRFMVKFVDGVPVSIIIRMSLSARPHEILELVR